MKGGIGLIKLRRNGDEN